MTSLRYRAVVRSVMSLRGEPPGAIAPTLAAVAYAGRDRRGIAPLADVYVPERPTGASAVLVHGGAFVIGSRRMKPTRYLATRLASAGIGVCAFDYRMIFRGGRLDEALADVRDALAFWRGESARLGLDPARVTLIGNSAGGTLALLAAAAAGPGELASVIACFGLYELDHLRGPLAELLPRLLFRTAKRSTWNARSPYGAPQPTVPTLLLHGTADGLVPVEQARRLAALREQQGLPTRLVVYEDAPHGFFNDDHPAREPAVREIVSQVSAARAGDAQGARP